jgi:hypothetical protein
MLNWVSSLNQTSEMLLHFTIKKEELLAPLFYLGGL